LIPVSREVGIKMLLDLHTPPDGYDQKDQWPSEKMVNRYINETQSMGYDLVNKPNDQDLTPRLMTWRDLAIAAVQRVRTIDSLHPIIVEASRGGGYNTLSYFQLLPYNNYIYSFHIYRPSEFTFQNIFNNVTFIYYPGSIIFDSYW